jgi:PDZ domain/Aspartyl protease
VYMDLRTVQGVTIPHRVRASRGDPRQDETVIVEAMDFNAPLTGVRFGQPPPPKPDYMFPAGKDAVEVPLEVLGGHLFIRVHINGKGPYRMLFDSGSLNVLMPDIARKLELKNVGAAAEAGTPRVGVVKPERVDVGGIVLTGQSFATVDLNAVMRRVEGIDDIAGVIGAELLNRFPVRLDYAKSRATFYNPAAFKYAGNGVAVPVTFRGNAPKIAGTVDGVAGAFAIDIGSRGSLTLSTPFAEANDLAARFGAKTEAIVGAGVGGPVRALLARATALEFSGIVIKNPVTALVRNGQGLLGDSDLAGVIGYGILRQFDLTFDLPHNVVYFDKNQSFGSADIHDRSGLWLERGPKGYEVIGVVGGGPAAAAGIKVDDVIVAIDGKNWSATTLANVRNMLKAAPGTKVRLKLGRGSESVVTLQDLI